MKVTRDCCFGLKLFFIFTSILIVLSMGFQDSFAEVCKTFVGLGDLPGGDFSSNAIDISVDGSVVIGTSSSANGVEAFIWDAENGMVGLGDLPGNYVHFSPYAISADGSVVVGAKKINLKLMDPNQITSVGESIVLKDGTIIPIDEEAFIWDAENGMVGLGDLPGGKFLSKAAAISADGSVVIGMSSSAKGPEAFIWDAENGMVGLGDLPGGDFASKATAISADGSVVVGDSVSANGPEAFIWDAENGMVGLGDLPGGVFSSNAIDISADGSVVVGDSVSANGPEAFIWDAENGMVGLGDLPGNKFLSTAFGVSSDGSKIVGYSEAIFDYFAAFIWDAENGMIPLANLPERHLPSYPSAISHNGSVVVGSSSFTNNPEGGGFVWHAKGGLLPLGGHPSKYFSSSPTAISSDGSVIVGRSNSVKGTEAFITSCHLVNDNNQKLIPDWIHQVSYWWIKGLISDKEFLGVLGYSAQIGVIQVDDLKIDPDAKMTIFIKSFIARWFTNNVELWVSGEIPDEGFLLRLPYLFDEGLISYEKN